MASGISRNVSGEQLAGWFRQKLAEEMGVRENDMDLNAPIDSYKLDSLSLVSISFELEGYLNTSIDPTVFSEFSTINEIIRWISEKHS